MDYETILYHTQDGIATITLNRPERMNAILPLATPKELEAAIREANADPAVHVIVLRGAGNSFCAGFDMQDVAGAPAGLTEEPWEPFNDLMWTTSTCASWMSMWRGAKPVIAQVHGWCVGGGTDMALCCDIIIAAEDARFGYPPARVWGSPTSFMWVYRLGASWAKYLMFTGDAVDGRTAERIGLILKAVPRAALEGEVHALARRMAQIPLSQLVTLKLIVNQAYENMGLTSTQLLGCMADGAMRHTVEGRAFTQSLQEKGMAETIAQRDAPHGDYSQRPKPTL